MSIQRRQAGSIDCIGDAGASVRKGLQKGHLLQGSRAGSSSAGGNGKVVLEALLKAMPYRAPEDIIMFQTTMQLAGHTGELDATSTLLLIAQILCLHLTQRRLEVVTLTFRWARQQGGRGHRPLLPLEIEGVRDTVTKVPLPIPPPLFRLNLPTSQD